MNKVYRKHRVDPRPLNQLIVSRSDKLAEETTEDRYEELVVTRWARRAGLMGDTHNLRWPHIK